MHNSLKKKKHIYFNCKTKKFKIMRMNALIVLAHLLLYSYTKKKKLCKIIIKVEDVPNEFVSVTTRIQTFHF